MAKKQAWHWICPYCGDEWWTHVNSNLSANQAAYTHNYYMVELWKCMDCGKYIQVYLDIEKVLSLDEGREL